jgi:hypothetical protein
MARRVIAALLRSGQVGKHEFDMIVKRSGHEILQRITTEGDADHTGTQRAHGGNLDVPLPDFMANPLDASRR